MQYEYIGLDVYRHTAYLTLSDKSREKSSTVKFSQVANRLNELGLNGWELKATQTVSPDHSVFILMREKREAPPPQPTLEV